MKRLITTLMAAVLLTAIPIQSHAGEPTEPLKVFVSILPQQHTVSCLCGEVADIKVLVGPGQSPATYEPTPKVMAALSEADVYFTIGVPFEKSLIKKIGQVMPDLKIVMTGSESADHDDHENGTHHHHDDGIDPHVWLDPLQVKGQVDSITVALSKLAPQWSEMFAANRESLHAALDSLHTAIQKKLAPYAGRRFFVFHPAFGHFSQRYGLEQVAIEIEGKEPSGKHLATLIEKARADGAGTIFIQKQFSEHAAEAIAREIGADVVELDALAPDYFDNMLRIADRLAASFAVKEPK